MTSLKSTRSDVFYKQKNMQPLDLTVTMEGTGSATAYLLGNKIIVTCAAAQVSKYVNISTPLGFTVRYARTRHDNATATSVQLANTTDAIGTAIAIAASDTDLDIQVDVDNAYATFLRGDDDLRLIIATGAFTGVVEIEIEPTVG